MQEKQKNNNPSPERKKISKMRKRKTTTAKIKHTDTTKTTIYNEMFSTIEESHSPYQSGGIIALFVAGKVFSALLISWKCSDRERQYLSRLYSGIAAFSFVWFLVETIQ